MLGSWLAVPLVGPSPFVIMSCPHRAILIFTRDVKGTSSNVASGRVELSCGLDAGHDGMHRDDANDEEWKDRGDEVTHLLRMVDDDG
jgi:hypothetical protein